MAWLPWPEVSIFGFTGDEITLFRPPRAGKGTPFWGPHFGGMGSDKKQLGIRVIRVHSPRRIHEKYRFPMVSDGFWDGQILSGYGSIPINTIFRGMNIHLPAILGFTRYQGFDTLPYDPIFRACRAAAMDRGVWMRTARGSCSFMK